MFLYKKGITTVDEIIGHLLFRLNTDFIDTYIPIKDFCLIDNQTIDRIMATRVLEKMMKYDVATSSPGTGCDEFDVILRPNGESIVSTDQWIKLTTLQDKIMEEKEKQNKPQPTINNYGNLVNGDNNSGFNQDFDSGKLRSNHNSIIREPALAKQTPIITFATNDQSSIWKKIYKWTDHKLISILILAILGFFATDIWTWIKQMYEKL